MVEIVVRDAVLDDTQDISALFRARINVWQRLDARGYAEDVPYDALTIHERFLHGGAWMSIETGALHLSHLLLGAGVPLVAEVEGRVRGYAEAYHSIEPPPFGKHLNLAELTVDAHADGAALADALIEALLQKAKALKCQRFMVSCTGGDDQRRGFYHAHGMAVVSRVRRLNVPARQGQVFYRAVEHADRSAAQIAGWYMPIGRLTSARQQWETHWHGTFDALAEIRERRTDRLHFNAAGQTAFVCYAQKLFDPRAADVYQWSQKPLTSQYVMAIRDWAHRGGYRTLTMVVPPEMMKVLGVDAEEDGYVQEVFSVEVA